ncbi:unnamed protein product [Penicillium salamii]|uniref:Uncharacterized protein n=1 Tax=Penicillium salamii TaxID=1612424 RepID=A0A9W4NI99_9EURO|nr:unnamed protein product [Penicillium salamii]CAG7989859.1 unnamed protein product [Penicillium salamii]CAG8274062.1 unnamed protein product [Penicillium salamii]CAG8353875.1 unnamed protein product [Penicillium salamii]CAG8357447.1 unnamed protein product [Penicillium salamii]
MAFEMFKTGPEYSSEFKLFKGLVDDEVTVDDAVQWVIGATMDRLEGYGPGGTIDKADAVTFMAILELVMRIDQAQYGPLVAFLKELKMYNAVDSTTGLVLKARNGSWVWSHLPSLTTCARKILAEFERDDDYLCDPNVDPEQQIRWAKMNIFLAKSTQAADVKYTSSSQVFISDGMDESHIGLCGLRQIFEEGIPTEQLTSGVGLLGVCYWFICAGDRLWENVLNGRQYNKYDGRPGDMFWDRNWRGFERERWDVWQKGLRDAQDACLPGQEDVKDLISRALSKMESLTNDSSCQ